VGEVLATPAAPSRPQGDQRHVGAERDHELEGEMDDRHIGPFVARHDVESLDLRTGIVEGEEREPVRDLDRAPRSPRCHVRPAAAYAASAMCTACGRAAGFAIAASGSTFTARPATSSNPVGVFIHALAITTKMPDRPPLTATSTPAARWARREIRSHP